MPYAGCPAALRLPGWGIFGSDGARCDTAEGAARRPSGGQGIVVNEDGRIAAGGGAPLRIVGVGASAGGLDALKRLFAALPANPGAAFVVVQHLDQLPQMRVLADFLQLPTGLSARKG